MCPAVGGDQAAGFRSCGSPLRGQGSDRWFWVVLDVPAHVFRAFDRVETCDEVEGHVDPRRDPCGRDDLAAVDEPVVGPHLDGGLELGERLEATPPGRTR